MFRRISILGASAAALVQRQSSVSNPITPHSSRSTTSGWVVKGNFIIV